VREHGQRKLYPRRSDRDGSTSDDGAPLERRAPPQAQPKAEWFNPETGYESEIREGWKIP